MVTRDSVQIMLMTDALNSIDLLGDDVQNEFLTEPNRYKSWLRFSLGFGTDQGNNLILMMELYGFILASGSFWEYT